MNGSPEWPWSEEASGASDWLGVPSPMPFADTSDPSSVPSPVWHNMGAATDPFPGQGTEPPPGRTPHSAPNDPFGSAFSVASPSVASNMSMPASAAASPMHASPVPSGASSPQTSLEAKITACAVETVPALQSRLSGLAWELQRAEWPGDVSVWSSLGQRLSKLVAEVRQWGTHVHQLVSSMVLEASTTAKVLSLQNSLLLLVAQAEVYIAEVASIPTGTMTTIPARLMIVEQPYPKPTKKSSQEDPITLRLLVGARMSVRAVSQAQAKLYYLDTEDEVENAVENDSSVVGEDGLIHFRNIRFKRSSRMECVRLKFFLAVQCSPPFGNAHMATIESPWSSVGCIITTESQWAGTLAQTLKVDMFGHQPTVAWPTFVNKLQRVYLMGTRQKVTEPERPFSPGDLQYMHTNFFQRMPNISKDAYDRFWAWFGPVLSSIRHQRQVTHLWCQGFILGFISKQHATELLHQAPDGAFLVRYSERAPGQFAVAWVKRGQVKHFLVPKEDVSPSPRSLAGFILEHRNFSTVLQVRNGVMLQGVEKANAFGTYHSATNKVTLPGYVDRVDD